MSTEEERFFGENIISVNKLIERIFCISVIIPVLVIAGRFFGIFVVEYSFCLIFLGLTVIFSIAEIILNRFERFQYISMYFGLIGAIILINWVSSTGKILIFISYGFFPMLASLYYRKTVTSWITFISYVSMLVSMWLRRNFTFDLNPYTRQLYTPEQWYLIYTGGLTIEYIFTYIIAITITYRSGKTLKNLTRASGERNDFLEKLRIRNRDLNETQSQLFVFIAECLGSHDMFTGHHVIHTRAYTEVIAKKLRDSGYYREELTDEYIYNLKTAALLHDIGKIHIPEGILNKPGKFTEIEYEMMKLHPYEGKRLCEALPKIDGGEFNRTAIEAAYYHHEKWDGTGYPNGLAEKNIPLTGRILAAADVLDAIISRRLYKEAMSVDTAMEIFRESSGTHFEPCIAETVIASRNEIAEIDRKFKEEEKDRDEEELEWWRKYHELFSRYPKDI